MCVRMWIVILLVYFMAIVSVFHRGVVRFIVLLVSCRLYCVCVRCVLFDHLVYVYMFVDLSLDVGLR